MNPIPKRADCRVAVAIATSGRPTILTETLRELCRQTLKPALVAICPAEPKDVERDALDSLDLAIHYTTGDRGASAQRNALLRLMRDIDVVLFLDDDFFLAPTYLAELARLFAADATVALATGTLIADGAHGPGIDPAEARALIADAPPLKPDQIEDIFNGYGCNMAVRWSAVAGRDVWFDEALPLYSWAEDVEYSRQVARFGRIVRSNRLCGVHLGTKRGRTSGVRFGYSQVANQAYLCRKGVISARLALLYGGRNVLANLVGTLRSEGYIDRRGRLLGNYYGLVDLLRGRSSPGRILEL